MIVETRKGIHEYLWGLQVALHTFIGNIIVENIIIVLMRKGIHEYCWELKVAPSTLIGNIIVENICNWNFLAENGIAAVFPGRFMIAR